MGFGVMALIGVQASNDLNRIAELVSTWPETTYVVISAGSFDLLIELVCTDNNDLLRVVERLRAVDGVRSTESFIYISRHKLNYAYAADRDDVPATDVARPAEPPGLSADEVQCPGDLPAATRWSGGMLALGPPRPLLDELECDDGDHGTTDGERHRRLLSWFGIGLPRTCR